MTQTIITLFLLLAAFPSVNSHGLVSWPRQRGLLSLNNFKLPELNPSAEPDYCPHCLNGGGMGNVRNIAPNNIWTPYDPTNKSFPFREDHAICGDPKGETDHKAPNGRFVTGETIAVYEKGDYMDMEIHISAHHNGFFSFFVCSLDCCGTADIEKKCFQNGCCKKLIRVSDKSCESGQDRVCGPVDPKYPGRWYLPPRDMANPESNWYGGINKKMRYTLPADMTCNRCVIHWYYTTANSCNPPGYADYNFPIKWAGLPGDGGARGSINRALGKCGDTSSNFPEEFWTCSENVRIVPTNSGRSRTLQIFHDGRMNIESPRDIGSGQPSGNRTTKERRESVSPSAIPVTYSVSPSATPVTYSVTFTPAPTVVPASTATASFSVQLTIPVAEPNNIQNMGSDFNVFSYFTSYDTGVCVKSDDIPSLWEVCVNLGFGFKKCFWCHKDLDGKDKCLHLKPNSTTSC